MKNKTSPFKKGTYSLIAALLLSSIALEPISAATKQMNIAFPEDPSEEQTKTFSLPIDFDSVTSITTNTGDASYSVNGGNLNVTVKNGTPSSSSTVFNAYKYSKLGSLFKYSNQNIFPNTATYADADGYNGILNKIGSSYLVSGSYTPGSSKTVTDSVVVGDAEWDCFHPRLR